jgi:hypothetical protein
LRTEAVSLSRECALEVDPDDARVAEMGVMPRMHLRDGLARPALGVGRNAIELVRDRLSDHTEADIPSGTVMAALFAAFRRALPGMCRRLGKAPKRLTFGYYTRLVVGWLAENSGVTTPRPPAGARRRSRAHITPRGYVVPRKLRRVFGHADCL